MGMTSHVVMAGLVPAIHVLRIAQEDVDARETGERSDAVLQTAMPARDDAGKSRVWPPRLQLLI
jgi:hypothetical protein